jgi:hypothetical protein
MTAEFRSKLIVEPASEYDDGQWRLTSTLSYYSEVLGALVMVPPGFVTDFASVPRIPVVYELCGDTSSEASVVHDWAYTQHFCTRAQADAVLKEASLATGVPRWRAWLMWAGVRVFGGSHWRN